MRKGEKGQRNWRGRARKRRRKAKRGRVWEAMVECADEATDDRMRKR